MREPRDAVAPSGPRDSAVVDGPRGSAVVDGPRDLVVVGAGPAGMAAAATALDGGLRVVLVDSGAAPGGQFWRHPRSPHRRPSRPPTCTTG